MTGGADAAFEEWITEQTGGLGLVSADAHYTNGYQDGWAAHAALVSNWLGIVDAGLALPLQQDLERARQFTNDPCLRGARNLDAKGKLDCDCSRCTRYMASWLNTRQFGQPDYPGAEEAARLRPAVAS